MDSPVMRSMRWSLAFLFTSTLISGLLTGCQPDDSASSNDHGRKQGGIAQNFGMIMGGWPFALQFWDSLSLKSVSILESIRVENLPGCSSLRQLHVLGS